MQFRLLCASLVLVAVAAGSASAKNQPAEASPSDVRPPAVAQAGPKYSAPAMIPGKARPVYYAAPICTNCNKGGNYRRGWRGRR